VPRSITAALARRTKAYRTSLLRTKTPADQRHFRLDFPGVRPKEIAEVAVTFRPDDSVLSQPLVITDGCRLGTGHRTSISQHPDLTVPDSSLLTSGGRPTHHADKPLDARAGSPVMTDLDRAATAEVPK
jgi:hypothetical protein